MKNTHTLKNWMILLFAPVVFFLLSSFSSLKKDDDIQEALEMVRYEKDTSASAIIVSDVGRSFFNFNHPSYGLELVFERKIIIKIFDSDGYGWADFYIPLYIGETNEEEVVDLKGFTYNLVDGKVEKTKLSKESIFEEKTSDNYKQVKVTMPDVHEGSVFEISYRVSSPFIFNLQSWTFQKSIPVVYSEYKAEIPEYLEYNKNVRGYFPIADHQSEARMSTIGGTVTNSRASYLGGPARTQSTSAVNFVENVETWITYDIPAFSDEPYMTDADNFMTAITFELAYTKFPNGSIENYTTTWEDINRKLMEQDKFGKALERTGFLKTVMPAALGSAGSDDEKIANIYNYIHAKVAWNGKSSLFTSGNLKSVLEDGNGNSADINLLLISMLREAGIKTFPVALSTRDHGMIFPTNPTITSFNYLVAGVAREDQYLLIDATEPNAPLGIIPYRCLNGVGRILDDQGGKWVELSSKSEKEKTIAEYTFDLEEEIISGKHNHIYCDQAAYGFRNEYAGEDGSRTFKEKMEKTVSGLGIKSVALEKMQELREDPSSLCDIKLEDHYVEAGEMIYFNPLFFDAMKSNPFRLEKRDYPVDYGVKSDDFYYAKINLPEDYAVESVPEEISIILPGRAAEYIYSAKVVGNLISVRSQLKINQTIFTAEHYAELKNFYDLVVKKQSEQIVLKRV